MSSSTSTAAGPAKLPQTAKAASATQAAWRFYNNERVTLAALVEPLREAGRQACRESAADVVLLAHDWSKLDWSKLDDGKHTSKVDRLQLTHQHDIGYDLTCALLVDADTGAPLAPMEMHLKTGQAMHSTSDPSPEVTAHHLEQLQPIMERSTSWQLDKPLVHLIDREADSLGHFRSWAAAGHLFLVRGDDRRVLYNDTSMLLSQIIDECDATGKFQTAGEVLYHGRAAVQELAEVEIVLHKPHKTRVDGVQKDIPGEPLSVRLVLSRIYQNERLVATWKLLTNVPRELAQTQRIALWYYWRWRIESFYKLLKSHGQAVEEWQQETGLGIARRLLVTAMACVVVWQLQRASSPEAEELKRTLIRLSGRQMKHNVPSTAPALLAGYFVLLSITEFLNSSNWTLEDLQSLAQQASPFLSSA